MAIGRSVQDFLFRFIGDSDSLEAAARRSSKALGQTDNASSKASKGFLSVKNAVAAAGAFIAGSKIVSFLGSAVASASELEQSVGGVQSVFGDAAGKVLAYGENAATSLGLAKSEFNNLALLTGSLLKNMGVDMADATQKTFSLTERASDLAATFGGPVSSAVEAINSALKGENNPIEKYGIKLSAAAVEAKVLATNTGLLKKDITDAHKAAAIYEIIMEQSADVTGQFAKEADTLAGAQERLNAKWKDAQAELGKQLIPMMQELTEAMIPMAGWVAEATESFGLGIKAIGNLGASLGFTNDAMFELDRILGNVNNRFREGASNTQVAAELMANLAAKGALTAEVLQAVQDATHATAEEMIVASEYVKEHADELGIAAENTDQLTTATNTYAQELLNNATAAQDAYTESSRNAAEQLRVATEGAAGLSTEVVNLSQQMQNAASPVFQAKTAIEAYDQALKDAREDGIVTGAELLELAPKFAAAATAKDALTADNFGAFAELLGQVKEDAGAIDDSFANALTTINNLTASAGMQQFAETIARFEKAVGHPINIDVSGLRFATDSEIEQAVHRALMALQRKGSIRPIAL